MQDIETNPTIDLEELENSPPSPSEPETEHHSRHNDIFQHIHRNHCSIKIKKESEERDILQSHDQCDSNNNSNKTQNNHKTKIAKQIQTVIRNGDFDELLLILRSKPDLNVFINGQTALHYCLLFGRDVSWCRQLVLNGANPNLSNHDGWHPLHLAAYKGLHESLTYLITCNTNKGVNSDLL